MRKSIYIVIAFYNEEQLLARCIASFINTLGLQDRVVIVDNSSIEVNLSGKYIEFSNIEIIRTAPGIGFGRANNIGAHYAIGQGASYILCLNQDTIVDDGLLTKLSQPFIEDENIIMSAPLILDYDTDIIEPFYIRWYYSAVDNFFSDAINNKIRHYYITQKVSGACFLIKTSFISAFGFFDENYFMYLEDEDLCRRITSLKFKIVLVPSACIYHIHSNTKAVGKHKWRKTLWQRQSSNIYFLKNRDVSFSMSLFSLLKKNMVNYFDLFLGFQMKLLVNYLLVDLKTMINIGAIYKSYKKEGAFNK